MATEWLRVMMEEVERKRREQIAARAEIERRRTDAPLANAARSALAGR
jgi:hypothetical protein